MLAFLLSFHEPSFVLLESVDQPSPRIPSECRDDVHAGLEEVTYDARADPLYSRTEIRGYEDKV